MQPHVWQGGVTFTGSTDFLFFFTISSVIIPQQVCKDLLIPLFKECAVNRTGSRALACLSRFNFQFSNYTSYYIGCFEIITDKMGRIRCCTVIDGPIT